MDTSSLVWISGASSGIGRALADTVPWPDAHLIDLSRSGGHPSAEHVAVDLATTEGWQAAAASFERELSRFAGERVVFVHCAATLDPMRFAAEADPEDYARAVLLNSASPQVLGQAFLAAVRDRDVAAHLVQISSGAATSVYPGWSVYGPAKAAVEHWTRHAGAEEESRGRRARVIAVAPGVVATAMQEHIRATDPEDFPQAGKFVGLYERGELRDPEDAARDIWRLVESDLDNGSIVDVRDLK